MEENIIIAIAVDLSSSRFIILLIPVQVQTIALARSILLTNPIHFSQEEAEDDILFLLYQLLMYGRRHSKVPDFLDTVHLYNDTVFKEHFRRHVVYIQIDMLQQSVFIPSHFFGMRKISAEMDKEIKWPEGNNAILRRSQKFEAKQEIKKCIGTTDCTHIAIRQPIDHPRDYCNRKRFFSIHIILQGVVDTDMKFTNIYYGEPGSLHDAHVLKRVFGYLKERFRHLRFLELLNIQFILKLVTAAYIMHNIVIKENNENEFFVDNLDDFLIDNTTDDNYEIYILIEIEIK
ncbi:hypothetical protein P5V15_008320 [Pogonomyrmex californicus]